MAGVVFHLNEEDPKKHLLVLKNIRNVRKTMPDLVIELVVHGPALGLVVASQSTQPDELEALQNEGVRVAVCQNTMQAQQLTEADLLPGMTIVRAGIAEIIQRQQEGYSYVKP